jgi:hypothetical protein
MSDEKDNTVEATGGAGFPRPSRLWPRLRFWLTLALMVTLTQGWVDSMRNYSQVALYPGKASLHVISGSGSAYLVLSFAGPKGYLSFENHACSTPLNQETLFPRPKLSTAASKFYSAVVPYWLSIIAAFFLGIVVPGALQRWRRPPSTERWVMLTSWCTGWLVLLLALILGGRWWSLRPPRIDETSHFILTGVNEPGLAVKDKMRGVATGKYGWPLYGLRLAFANAGLILTDDDGKFEIPFTTGEYLFCVCNGAGADPVKISIDPDRPMYWRIQEK